MWTGLTARYAGWIRSLGRSRRSRRSRAAWVAKAGALTVSCFSVTDEVEAQIVVRGTRWSVYGVARVGDLLTLGCRLVATDAFENEDLLPLSDRHVDVIVPLPVRVRRVRDPGQGQSGLDSGQASLIASLPSSGRSILAGPSTTRRGYDEGCARCPAGGRRPGPFEATITGIEADGTLILAVHAFVPARPEGDGPPVGHRGPHRRGNQRSTAATYGHRYTAPDLLFRVPTGTCGQD